MAKKTSELLKQIRAKQNVYGVPLYTEEWGGDYFNALNRAIELFEQLEDIGIDNISDIRSAGGTAEYENIEFPINEEVEAHGD